MTLTAVSRNQFHSSRPQAPSRVHVKGLNFKRINHLVVFSGGDPKNLRRILFNPAFPDRVEVITGELSLIGWKEKPGSLLARALPELRHQIVFAKKSGNLEAASRLEEEYKKTAMKAREMCIAFAVSCQETGGLPKEILDLSKRKKLTLWVGAPRYDKNEKKLYNSIFRVTDGKIVGAHDKEFLYSTEKDVFDSPELFNGDFGKEISLICWEAEALNPHFHKPSPLEGMKEGVVSRKMGDPLLTLVSAYWPTEGGIGLRGQVSRAVRRATGSDRHVGLRHEGSLALVSNDGAEACVTGPSRLSGDPRKKSEVYASVRKPGMIRVTSTPDGDLALSEYDLFLRPVEN